VQDLTEHQQAQMALQESEARFRAIVPAMTEGIVLHNRDRRILVYNAAAERIWGLTEEQFMGRSQIDPRWWVVQDDFLPFPRDIRPGMVSLRTGQPVSNVVMGLHKPDDTLTWTLVNSPPLFQPGEAQPCGVVVSFAAITPIKQMGLALQQSEARLRSIFETIDDAVRYSRPGGEVMVRAALREGEVIIEVEDHGAGAPGARLRAFLQS
jgi:PAS domain-containing protein